MYYHWDYFFRINLLLLFNFNEYIVDTPESCQRLSCGDSLFTVYSCPISDKFSELWSHQNYIIYVEVGRKIWHTPHGPYDLQPGSCVFVRRGAAIIEQFTEAEFCFYLFFVSDEFICEVLKSKATALCAAATKYEPVINIQGGDAVHSFFRSMLPYFNAPHKPDQALLELKFRELILMLADNPRNKELISYFCSLLRAPQTVSLQTVMDDNFCFNLKLEDFARLSYRSLSGFKRDFVQVYNTSPGKWLMEKRLQHAKHLLAVAGKSVSDAAFESGFEHISHFSRAFSKQFGMAPSAVRKATAVLS